jgi:hypothetical protein
MSFQCGMADWHGITMDCLTRIGTDDADLEMARIERERSDWELARGLMSLSCERDGGWNLA